MATFDLDRILSEVKENIIEQPSVVENTENEDNTDTLMSESTPNRGIT